MASGDAIRNNHSYTFDRMRELNEGEQAPSISSCGPHGMILRLRCAASPEASVIGLQGQSRLLPIVVHIRHGAAAACSLDILCCQHLLIHASFYRCCKFHLAVPLMGQVHKNANSAPSEAAILSVSVMPHAMLASCRLTGCLADEACRERQSRSRLLPRSHPC